jgi:hypothetical protein
MISMAEIETAYARMLKSDVKYRFVSTWRHCRPRHCPYTVGMVPPSST